MVPSHHTPGSASRGCGARAGAARAPSAVCTRGGGCCWGPALQLPSARGWPLRDRISAWFLGKCRFKNYTWMNLHSSVQLDEICGSKHPLCLGPEKRIIAVPETPVQPGARGGGSCLPWLFLSVVARSPVRAACGSSRLTRSSAGLSCGHRTPRGCWAGVGKSPGSGRCRGVCRPHARTRAGTRVRVFLSGVSRPSEVGVPEARARSAAALLARGSARCGAGLLGSPAGELWPRPSLALLLSHTGHRVDSTVFLGLPCLPSALLAAAVRPTS